MQCARLRQSAPNFSRSERKSKRRGMSRHVRVSSGADGAGASPIHARLVRSSVEKAWNLRLVGGASEFELPVDF